MNIVFITIGNQGAEFSLPRQERTFWKEYLAQADQLRLKLLPLSDDVVTSVLKGNAQVFIKLKENRRILITLSSRQFRGKNLFVCSLALRLRIRRWREISSWWTFILISLYSVGN